jgi:hypothetical protein
VPVFISSLVSNLKDHPPFYSVETDDHPPADVIFERATAEYRGENFDDAFQSFRFARDLDALRFQGTVGNERDHQGKKRILTVHFTCR